jgi:hypothetical protein
VGGGAWPGFVITGFVITRCRRGHLLLLLLLLVLLLGARLASELLASAGGELELCLHLCQAHLGRRRSSDVRRRARQRGCMHVPSFLGAPQSRRRAGRRVAPSLSMSVCASQHLLI